MDTNLLLAATTLDFMEAIGEEMASSLTVVMAKVHLMSEKEEFNREDFDYLMYWLRITRARFNLSRAYQYELKSIVQGEVKPDVPEASVSDLSVPDRRPVSAVVPCPDAGAVG